MSSPREVLADTQRFYRKCVYRSWVHGYMSGRYLAGMIAPAGIGYAPKGWTATSDHLRRLGHDPETIISAGVAVQSSRGLRDVMRDRLIFPVRDHTGDLVGFLGRASPDAGVETPKYLNSPATELYDKGSTLYGLGEQADVLRSGAVPLIVEGPMDKLAVDRALADSGTSVVGLASCGTALTHEHLARLMSITESPPWFCFDSDEAGSRATLRAWELTRDFGRARLMVVRLPKGHDPASVHPHALNAAISGASPMSVVVADIQLTAWGRPDNPMRAEFMVSELARRDASRVTAEDAGEWIATVACGTGLPAADVQSSLLDAVSPSTAELHDACFPTPIQSIVTRSAHGSRAPVRPNTLRLSTTGIQLGR